MFSIKNEKGFSQVNLFVGVFFLAVVVFLVVHTVKKQTQSLKNITAEAEIEAYLSSLKRHLSSPINCNKSLTNIRVNNGLINSIKVLKEDNFQEIFQQNTSIGTSNTKIISYQTSSFNSYQENIADLGMINLVITLEKDLESKTSSLVKRELKLYIKKKSDMIDECAFGGLPTGERIDIEHPEGTVLNSPFVGINTQDVKASLNVSGTITLDSSNGLCTTDSVGSIQFNKAREQFEQCMKDFRWQRIHR